MTVEEERPGGETAGSNDSALPQGAHDEAKMSTHTGKDALGRLFARALGLETEHGAALGDRHWDDFKEAIREAQAELREESSAGRRRWTESRRGRADG